MSGCKTTENYSLLAPAPPSVNSYSFVQNFRSTETVVYQEISLLTPELQAEPLVMDNAQVLAVEGDNDIVNSLSGCRIKDRFDRKALIAYEWGRSRVSVDVDGINLSGGGDRGVFLAYKLRLQPEKTKAQRCRYNSNWQGLIGSGYHELVLREENTVWSEIKEIKAEVLSRFD